MQIFAGVREIWGVKQESGRLRCRFSYLSLAIFSESSSPRLKSATHSICVKLIHKHDKLTQCCHAFTLALARLSCYTEVNTKHNPNPNERNLFLTNTLGFEPGIQNACQKPLFTALPRSSAALLLGPISGSTGPIYIKFSPNGKYLNVYY